MNYDECIKFHRNMEETRKAISTTIRVDHDQVLQIVVSDLLRKYKHLKNTDACEDEQKTESFKTVLLYYLEPDELDAFYANPELIYKQD